MTDAKKWASISFCWLFGLIGIAPQVFAEKSEYLAPYSAHDGIRTVSQGLNEPGFTHDCAQPDRDTLTAIVPVATDHGSHASGIVIDNNRVLTAAHALQGAGHFFVRVGASFRSADLVMVDHKHDLAVLAVDTALIKPLRISGFSPAHSDPVWAAGYPRAQSMTTSAGVFQAFSGGALHTSATIDPGQSGGGLLSCSAGSWSLVGMLRGYGAYLQGDQYVKLENHSVSVAGTTINEFLSDFH